jgi:hypothetical protein
MAFSPKEAKKILTSVKYVFQHICAIQLIRRQNFYIQFRTFVAYPFVEEKKYTAFKSLKDYRAAPGSKLDLLIQLVKHSLLHDDIQPASFNDAGEAQWPLPPETPTARLQKVVIYHEFPMMASLILSVSYCTSQLMI